MGKRKSNDFDYKSAMRELRGIVNFNYPLNRKLSPGQKAAIHRSFNALAKVKRRGLTPVPVRRLPRESKAHLKKRSRELRAKTESNPLLSGAVTLQVPPGGRASLKKDGTIEFRFSGKLKHRREWYFEFPVSMWLAQDKQQLSVNLSDFLRPLIRKHKPTLLQMAHGPYRGISYALDIREYNATYAQLIDDALDLMSDDLMVKIGQDVQGSGSNEAAFAGIYLIRT